MVFTAFPAKAGSPVIAPPYCSRNRVYGRDSPSSLCGVVRKFHYPPCVSSRLPCHGQVHGLRRSLRFSPSSRRSMLRLLLRATRILYPNAVMYLSRFRRKIYPSTIREILGLISGISIQKNYILFLICCKAFWIDSLTVLPSVPSVSAIWV